MVAGFIRTSPSCRWVHLESLCSRTRSGSRWVYLGSFGSHVRTLGVDGYIMGHWVHRREQGFIRSQLTRGRLVTRLFTRARPSGSWVHLRASSRSLGSSRVVGFTPSRFGITWFTRALPRCLWFHLGSFCSLARLVPRCLLQGRWVTLARLGVVGSGSWSSLVRHLVLWFHPGSFGSLA